MVTQSQPPKPEPILPVDEKSELRHERVRRLTLTDSVVLTSRQSRRLDLEMELQVANTQKKVLQDEVNQLKFGWCLSSKLYSFLPRIAVSQEQAAHEELRITWKRANENFIEMQKVCVSSVYSACRLRISEC